MKRWLKWGLLALLAIVLYRLWRAKMAMAGRTWTDAWNSSWGALWHAGAPASGAVTGAPS